jgi:hypothetical protein
MIWFLIYLIVIKCNITDQNIIKQNFNPSSKSFRIEPPPSRFLAILVNDPFGWLDVLSLRWTHEFELWLFEVGLFEHLIIAVTWSVIICTVHWTVLVWAGNWAVVIWRGTRIVVIRMSKQPQIEEVIWTVVIQTMVVWTVYWTVVIRTFYQTIVFRTDIRNSKRKLSNIRNSNR